MRISRDLWLPLVTAATFAGSFVASKYATFELEPLTTTFVRYVIATLFLLVLVLRSGPRVLRVEAKDIIPLAAMGLTGVVGYHYFFFVSLHHTAVANTAVINALGPVVTALMAALLIRERLSGANYAGVLTAVVGVLLLVTRGRPQALWQAAFNHGDVLMLCAVVSWTVYVLIVKKLSARYGSLTLTFWSALFGTLEALLLSLPEKPMAQLGSISAVSVWSLLYMGVIASGIGYLFYNVSVERIGPTKTSSLVYSTVPVLVAGLALLFFGEPVTAVLALGLVLIVTGMHLVLRK